jgi:hypothetical protein
MPIELKRLQGERKRIVKVQADKGNGEVEQIDLAIWHKPITPDLESRLKEIADEIDREAIVTDKPADESKEAEKKKNVLVEQLAAVLTRWDVVDEGRPVVLNRETLEALEYELLFAIKTVIDEPLYPKSTT